MTPPRARSPRGKPPRPAPPSPPAAARPTDPDTPSSTPIFDELADRWAALHADDREDA